MKVDLYEKIWMWAAAALIVVFLAAIAVAAGSSAVHPPSHVETIDPTTVLDSPEFGNPGVTLRPDGSALVSIVASTFLFEPDEIRVPAGRPVTFRITSPDVIHGFQVVGTNANSMVIPGYVSEFTVTFARPGEHLITCNEYCGLLHHEMQATLIVEEAAP
jgi:cytochrome c oxidase subunit II